MSFCHNSIVMSFFGYVRPPVAKTAPSYPAPAPAPAPATATGLVKEVDVDTQQRAGECEALLKQCGEIIRDTEEISVTLRASNTIRSLKKLLSGIHPSQKCRDSVNDVKDILETYNRSRDTYDSGCKALYAILVAISKCDDSSVSRQGGRRKTTRKRKRKSNSRTKRRMRR